MATDDELPRSFPGGYVPIVGEVVGDGEVKLTPGQNGLADMSMKRFSEVFPYVGPKVEVKVKPRRGRRRR